MTLAKTADLSLVHHFGFTKEGLDGFTNEELKNFQASHIICQTTDNPKEAPEACQFLSTFETDIQKIEFMKQIRDLIIETNKLRELPEDTFDGLFVNVHFAKREDIEAGEHVTNSRMWYFHTHIVYAPNAPESIKEALEKGSYFKDDPDENDGYAENIVSAHYYAYEKSHQYDENGVLITELPEDKVLAGSHRIVDVYKSKHKNLGHYLLNGSDEELLGLYKAFEETVSDLVRDHKGARITMDLGKVFAHILGKDLGEHRYFDLATKNKNLTPE